MSVLIALMTFVATVTAIQLLDARQRRQDDHDRKALAFLIAMWESKASDTIPVHTTTGLVPKVSKLRNVNDREPSTS